MKFSRAILRSSYVFVENIWLIYSTIFGIRIPYTSHRILCLWAFFWLEFGTVSCWLVVGACPGWPFSFLGFLLRIERSLICLNIRISTFLWSWSDSYPMWQRNPILWLPPWCCTEVYRMAWKHPFQVRSVFLATKVYYYHFCLMLTYYLSFHHVKFEKIFFSFLSHSHQSQDGGFSTRWFIFSFAETESVLASESRFWIFCIELFGSQNEWVIKAGRKISFFDGRNLDGFWQWSTFNSSWVELGSIVRLRKRRIGTLVGCSTENVFTFVQKVLLNSYFVEITILHVLIPTVTWSQDIRILD